MYPVATLPTFGAIVNTCCTSSPIVGVPVIDVNLSAFNDEYVLSV